MRRRSRLPARLGCVTALVLAYAAFGVVVTDDPPQSARGADTTGLLVPVEARTSALAGQLGRLSSRRSGRPAQRALHATVEAVQAAQRAAGPGADERLANALERELEYLDAVGSLLSNPNSALASELAGRARRARAAFVSVPGGRPVAQAIRGHQRLLAISRARRSS